MALLDRLGRQPDLVPHGRRIRDTFGIGGIAAWIAFIVGAVAIGPNAARIARTNATIEATGRTPELEAQLVSANAAIHRAGQIGLVLLTIAIVCMAVARYA